MQFGVITSNISADFASPPGVPAWEERSGPYVHLIRDADPDLISVQEVMPRQLRFLQDELPEYRVLAVDYINGGDDRASSQIHDVRDEAIPNPYEIALFYRSNRFEAVEAGHWWMSPTPEYPSVGFGNIWPRMVLWARFRSEAGEIITFATHIDHRCVDAMIDLCRRRFDMVVARDVPQILAGDLNFNPTHTAYASLLTDGWSDSGRAAALESSTFLYDVPHWPSGRIDHIFWRGSRLRADQWSRLIPATGQPPISDHHPVHARLRLG